MRRGIIPVGISLSDTDKASKGYNIGLSVIHADTGEELGKLADVINAGASDIYVIDTPYGQRMMPAVDEFVVRIDLESGIYVRPIEGMFGEI